MTKNIIPHSLIRIEYNENRISIQCLLIALYLSLGPFSLVPIFAGISALKLITIPIAAYCIAALFIGNVRIDLNSVHLFFTLYILYTAAGALLLLNNEAWRSIRGYLELYVITMIFTIRVYTKKEQRIFENAMLISGVITVLFSIFSTQEMVEGRSTMSFFGAYCDPNELCGMIIVPLMVVLDRIIKEEKKFGYVVIAASMLYVTIATGSRGGLAAVVAAAFAFAVIATNGVRSKMVAIVGFALLVFVGVFVVFPLMPADLQERFSLARIMEDQGSGRFQIWGTLFASATKDQSYVIWGQGISSSANALLEAGFSNTVAHNHFLQVFHDQGLVGVILFLLMELSAILRCIRRRRFLSTAMIGMIALSLSLTFDPSVKVFWNTIMICAFCFGSDKEEKDE